MVVFLCCFLVACTVNLCCLGLLVLGGALVGAPRGNPERCGSNRSSLPKTTYTGKSSTSVGILPSHVVASSRGSTVGALCNVGYLTFLVCSKWGHWNQRGGQCQCAFYLRIFLVKCWQFWQNRVWKAVLALSEQLVSLQPLVIRQKKQFIMTVAKLMLKYLL